MVTERWCLSSLFVGAGGGVVSFVFLDPPRSGPFRHRFSTFGEWVGRTGDTTGEKGRLAPHGPEFGAARACPMEAQSL